MKNYTIKCKTHGEFQVYGDGTTSCPDCEEGLFAVDKEISRLTAENSDLKQKLEVAKGALEGLADRDRWYIADAISFGRGKVIMKLPYSVPRIEAQDIEIHSYAQSAIAKIEEGGKG